MADDTARWNRVYDKLEDVHERISETNVKMAEVATQMGAHVDSDTTCFNRIDQNFRDLSAKLDEVCLSKKDAKKEAGKAGALWAGVVSIIVALIAACAQLAGH